MPPARQMPSLILSFSEPQATVVKGSENALIPIGETAILRCTFNKEVDCHWRRRGYDLEVAYKYTYVDTRQNGQRTKDCSIKMHSFDDIDAGQWQCHGQEVVSRNAVAKDPLSLHTGK